MRARVWCGLVGLGLVWALVGCAGVRPWEREVLARPEMAWDPDELAASQSDHVYFSKEASLPGGTAGGGGCGCN